ncbi:trypsin-1-like [Photinus pyralis]|uniref:trypsin-1-like n=1 Tax=Photinus pyralis TaxID=7054 RepID=UPI00126753B4|nr:trypsin-1-like [Photinus pyralis]
MSWFCEEIEIQLVKLQIVSTDFVSFQVGLRKTYTKEHYCGGSIIAPLYILTAAHCACVSYNGQNVPYSPSSIFILAGQREVRIFPNSTQRSVEQISIHEDYDSESMANDIALLRMSSELSLNQDSAINSIPLIKEILQSGACIVSGWGVTQYGAFSPNRMLALVEVQFINFTQCSKMYALDDIELTPGMLCAGTFTGGKDACQGDSGGPLAYKGMLAGVVSTGSGCADPKFPGVYSDIVYFTNWIQKTMSQMEPTTMYIATTTSKLIATDTTLNLINTTTTLSLYPTNASNTSTETHFTEQSRSTTDSLLVTTHSVASMLLKRNTSRILIVYIALYGFICLNVYL